MNKTVYKVVIPSWYDDEYNIFYSTIAWFENEDWYNNGHLISLKYELNKKTLPKIGKIFVFQNLDLAKNFIYDSYVNIGYAILKGIGENIGHIKNMSNSTTLIKEYWDIKNKKKKCSNTCKVFPGTLSCDSFLPEEIVFEYQTKTYNLH